MTADATDHDRAVHVTIHGIGPNDAIARIARTCRAHPAIRLEAGIIAGRATWNRRKARAETRPEPSFERLREMIAECRSEGLASAVHMRDCYTEMVYGEEHEVIRELTEGADRMQIEDTGYDYAAIDMLHAAIGRPAVVRNWNRFAGGPPSPRLEYLYTDIGQAPAGQPRNPKPWANVRCGYAGAGVNADPPGAIREMFRIGNSRGWIEIDRAAVADDGAEIDTAKLDRLLGDAARAAATAAQPPDLREHRR